MSRVEAVLKAVHNLELQDIAYLSRLGIVSPLWVRKSGVAEFDISESPAKFGYICHTCKEVALLFPGDRWVGADGKPSIGPNLYADSSQWADGEPPDEDIPPLDVPLAGIACVYAKDNPVVDRGSAKCPHCARPLFLDQGCLHEPYIVQVDVWTQRRIAAQRATKRRRQPYHAGAMHQPDGTPIDVLDARPLPKGIATPAEKAAMAADPDMQGAAAAITETFGL